MIAKTMKKLAVSVYLRLREVTGTPGWMVRARKFHRSHEHLKDRRKIIYALSPPPRLRNIGDHAQAVAIRKWFGKHFPDLPVMELDKDESSRFIEPLKRLAAPDDLLFLHSGGNLGDRGMWSETARRLLIRSFPQNRIFSLPQTIYFSNTETGLRERERSARIYGDHPRLTVMGRDPESGRLAEAIFPKATTFCMPDFVLSMPPLPPRPRRSKPRILLCLRVDNESVLSIQDRLGLQRSLPFESTLYDTTLSRPIPVAERERILKETLDLFQDHDAVVTDRYHGVIFAVLCGQPTVVLRTVDHKLTSAMEWFRDLPFVRMASGIEEVEPRLKECLAVTAYDAPNWNELYFDRLPVRLGLHGKRP